MSIYHHDLYRGRVAVVTGGGSGIGAGIARAFAAHGAQVAIFGRTQEKLDAVAADIGEACLPVSGDVREAADLERLMSAVRERWGHLDVLVNGAAGNFLSPAAALSPRGFGAVVDIDLKGTFNTCRAGFELLADGGGSIVNISATLQYVGTPLQVHAAAAKAGIDALTRSLSVEWGAQGIRVNAVAPGPIDDTPGMAKLAPGEMRRRMEKGIPLQRFGRIDEIASAVLFLASGGASYVTGATLVVDGGQWLAPGLSLLED